MQINRKFENKVTINKRKKFVNDQIDKLLGAQSNGVSGFFLVQQWPLGDIVN